MGDRLGDILVAQGACSEEAVRDALKNQIIFGGRLGTNLLELQAVNEEALARALGKQHRIPSVHGPQRLDPAAVALLAPEIADRYDAVPLLAEGRRLALIVVDPRNLAMLDEVAFVTGKSVHPVVAPEARIWALLRETYGVDRHLRGIEVDFAQLKSRIDHARGLTVPKPAAPEGDLMDEREFSALYRDRMTPATPPPAAPPAPAAAATRAPTPPPSRGAPAAARPAPAAPAPVAAPAPSPAPPPQLAPPEEVIELTELVEPEPWVAIPPPRVSPEAAALILATLDQAPGHAPPARLAPSPPPPEPEPTPLSFAEAVRALEGVDERDAIARTVLRYARSKFRRAVLFTVQRGVAHGWAGLGANLGPGQVRHVHLALGQPGILETVVSAQAHFLGPIPRTESNIRLLKALGGGVPGNALLLPILAIGRVVNLLYVDNGKGGTVESGDVGELLILATRIAKSYDTLLGRVR